MPSSYKNSAWFYDALSRVVYGRALITAQVYLLQFVPENAEVLIVGGGTGWILEELGKIHPAGLKIAYVEVAADMMRLSRKRDTRDNEVAFINAAIEDVLLPGKFDVVIAPFLFDNFTEQTFIKVFRHMQWLLKPEVLWLVTDFQLTGKWWQNILLKTMFIFFRVVCGIEASQLPDIAGQFGQNGYAAIERKTFFSDFVISTVYSNSVPEK